MKNDDEMYLVPNLTDSLKKIEKIQNEIKPITYDIVEIINFFLSNENHENENNLKGKRAIEDTLNQLTIDYCYNIDPYPGDNTFTHHPLTMLDEISGMLVKLNIQLINNGFINARYYNRPKDGLLVFQIYEWIDKYTPVLRSEPIYLRAMKNNYHNSLVYREYDSNYDYSYISNQINRFL